MIHQTDRCCDMQKTSRVVCEEFVAKFATRVVANISNTSVLSDKHKQHDFFMSASATIEADF